MTMVDFILIMERNNCDNGVIYTLEDERCGQISQNKPTRLPVSGHLNT